ncbi:hypothetical protein ACFQZJ_15940 [Maribacter chungangensis]|jgi:hypothetical protein|uniref:Uncharacterized protein n=1 Tax=Maribacter chungangensis TaxID=1069117 RepID=A0ABW3B8B2_9FLAO
MKKSRPVLFPEFIGNENMSSKVDVRWQDIRPEHKLKIGKPSNRYYQYIYPSLNFEDHSLDNLNGLLDYEGFEVYVRSILKMKNGESYAVLARQGDVLFSQDMVHIYAEIQKAHESFELLDA